MSSSRRIVAVRAAFAAVGTAAILALALLVATPASAHSTLTGSSPANGSTISTLPAEFSATFNEDLLDATGTGEGFVMQIIGPDGRHYEDGKITIDGPTVSTDALVGPAGLYTVLLRVISADGHPVEPSFQFTWTPDLIGLPTSTPAPTPTAEPSPPVATPVPVPEVTTSTNPLDVVAAPERPGTPGYLGGLIALVLILGGAIAAATSRRK